MVTSSPGLWPKEEEEYEETEEEAFVTVQLLFMMSLHSLLPGCFAEVTGYITTRLGVWVLPEKCWYWILLAASSPYPVQCLVRLWISVHASVLRCLRGHFSTCRWIQQSPVRCWMLLVG